MRQYRVLRSLGSIARLTRAAVLGAAAVGAACIVGAAAAPAAAQTDQADVTVAFSLSSRQVIQYEPVILSYRIANHRPDTIEVALGDQPTAWLGLRCTGPEGSPVEAIKAIRLPKGGLTFEGARISAHSHYGEDIVVQRIFRISSALCLPEPTLRLYNTITPSARNSSIPLLL